jgi:carbamate kinase
MIQQSLQNALARAAVPRTVVTLITQTLCDARDPALEHPTKPIGHGAWRRLAPSPRPRAVAEGEMIRELVHAGHVVIACGGGGPPVYRDERLGLEGIEAVVDKDRVAAILGRQIGADVLLILTNVDGVQRGYGTPHQAPIRRLTLAAADDLLAGAELGVGSMRPKVEAAADFVREARGGAAARRAIIAELADGLAALRGERGTTIAAERP